MARCVWDDWGVLPSAFHNMETIPVKEEAMKVQRKRNGVGSVQFEVVEETPKFYILHGVCLGEYVAVSKADYEPVQEWVDVTEECHIKEVAGHSLLIMHNDYQVGTAAATACSNLYRLKATGSHGIRVERRKA